VIPPSAAPLPNPHRNAESKWGSGATLHLATPDAEPLCDVARLSAAEQQRYRGAHSPARRRDFAVSRALLQAMDLDGETIPASAGRISLSHSGGYAALAQAPTGHAVGVDLERLRPRPVLELARHVCTSREIAALDALDADARLHHFYLLWTVKEAALKALGLDFPAGLRAVELLRDPAAGSWRLQWPTRAAWCLRVWSPRPGLQLAWILIALEPGDRRALHEPTYREWPVDVIEPWPVVLACEGE
jgi:4'-phosphopantetheinyl transferase